MKNKKLYICLLAVIIPVLMPLEVLAINDFYSANNILFYDPLSSGCLNTLNIYMSPDSKINQEITAKFLTSTNFLGNNNNPMNAVQMAAIMGNIEQESGFSPTAGTGGGSHQGIIQWDDGRWKDIAEPKKDLKNQLDFLKKELDGDYYKGKVGNEFWGATTAADLSKATYAIARNYEVAVLNGGGSTLWTNEEDATANIQDWWNKPQNKPENGRRVYAYDLYNKYGGLVGSGSGCGKLVSGGMTLEQAEDFINNYTNSADTAKYLFNASRGCPGGALSNCVSFSTYFINKYTTANAGSQLYGDGSEIISNLLALNSGMGYGDEPRPYAVFSQPGSSLNQYGHTGVILGVDKTNNQVIVGEASCSSTEKGGKINIETIDSMKNHWGQGTPKYIYPTTQGGI